MTFLGGHGLQRQVYRFLDHALARRSIQRLTDDAGPPVGRDRAGPG
jgi:hypothetical protein